MTGHFGTPATPRLRATEWKRLGVFLAFGFAAFLVAIVGASFVPLGLPDALRRWMHPNIFVPLGTALTVLMLRRDFSDIPASERFNPWPVAWSSASWFVAGEIGFRGYAFWRLIRLIGFWPAQAIVAGLFIVSHFTLGGYALLPSLVGIVAGSVLFGVVFARTQNLAAPIALHTGWNVSQHLLLSPLDPTATPLVVRFPHTPSRGEYALMLVWVALVMVAGTVITLRCVSGVRPGERPSKSRR